MTRRRSAARLPASMQDETAMRIVFVNRFYAPDESATSQLLTDLCQLLAAAGHDVTVIASRRRLSGGPRLPPRETIAGVSVRRAPSLRLGGGVAARLVDYATFMLSACVALWSVLRPGVVVVAKTDPPLLSVPVSIVARWRGAALVNWLQDVFPEVAMSLSRSHMLRRAMVPLIALRDRSCRAAACNVVLGARMAGRVAGENKTDVRIRIVHNWSPFDCVQPVDRAANPLRSEWGLADKFVVGYSGNLGRAHEFATLLHAAEALTDEDDVAFLVIGGGHQAGGLRAEAERRRLRNMHFKPHQPRAKLAFSLGAADAHIVSLVPELEGLIVPSKFYGVAAAARPVLFIGDARGEIASLVARARCGACVPVGDGRALARRIVRLARHRALADRWGGRALALYRNEYDRRIALDAWQAILSEATALTPARRSLSVAAPRASLEDLKR